MAKKRIYKRILVLVVLLIVGSVIFYFVHKVNAAYPQVKKVDVTFGQEAKLSDGLSMCVKNTKYIKPKEAEDLYGKEVMKRAATAHDTNYEIIQVSAVIKNTSEKEQNYDLYNITIANDAYSDGMPMELYDYDGAFAVNLKKGESKEVVLSYIMESFKFTAKMWSHFDDMEFYLASSHYPVKTTWEIK
jgi:hypothetical protein